MNFSLHPYKPRSIRFLELWEENGWKVKIYSICTAGERLSGRYVEIAKNIARAALPQPPVTASRYGVASVAIHVANMFNQIIVNWWERDNELRHHVFKAGPSAPTEFKNITATGEAFCVWELRVLGFERSAWLECILQNAKGPSIDEYLNRRLNEDV